MGWWVGVLGLMVSGKELLKFSEVKVQGPKLCLCDVGWRGAPKP